MFVFALGHLWLMGILSSLGCDIGNSAILNQLVAGSIIVMHIKSITVLSLPLRVYGPMRSMHNSSQGVVMARFSGYSPDNYNIFWHVIGLSFVDLSNTSRDGEFPWDAYSQGVEGSADTMLLHVVVGFLELSFCHFYRVFLYSQLTAWCNHVYQSLRWAQCCAFLLLLFLLLLEGR
jgi:hypothetical protein